MKQGTPEWFAARCGKVTASRVVDILPGARGYGASRKNYLAELLCERLTGKTAESYQSTAMAWGSDYEPLARAAYEFHVARIVDEVGFIEHPHIIGLGASPDGLVKDDDHTVGIEIKCPNTSTHLQTVLSGEIDYKYIVQMQVGMMCTGCSSWDFVSYDPRLPDRLGLFVKRVHWDIGLVEKITAEVRKFLAELDSFETLVREKMV